MCACVCVCPSVCVSVRVSVCPSVCLSVCLSVRLSVDLYVRLYVRLHVRLYVRLSVCPCVNLSVCKSVCPSVRLSLLLHICQRNCENFSFSKLYSRCSNNFLASSISSKRRRGNLEEFCEVRPGRQRLLVGLVGRGENQNVASGEGFGFTGKKINLKVTLEMVQFD